MSRIKTIKSYYESNMGKGLPDYGVLGWESEEAQHLRFDTIVSNVNLENKKILDVGCGLGNFLEYLNMKGINAYYTGVDILQSMIDDARKKSLNAAFYCIDIFNNNPFERQSFDVIYASGIFNLNLGNNKEFLMRAFGHLNELSREVIAFNLLHHQSPDKEDKYYYFSPDEVIDMIEKSGHDIKEINVIGQYLKNDFTVICVK